MNVRQLQLVLGKLTSHADGVHFMQQTLEKTIREFEQWQAERGAARMRIASLMRHGMAKSQSEPRISTPLPTAPEMLQASQ